MCPGAPFLIEGTADAIAARLSPVVDACSAALSRLPPADALVLLTTGAVGSAVADSPAWRVLPPGTVISTTPVRRSDLPDRPDPALLGRVAQPDLGPAGAVATLSVGTMVGAALLASHAHNAVSTVPPRPLLSPTSTIEITGDPALVAGMLSNRVHTAERIALLVIADGSACHGNNAPGRRDDRAVPFDAALAQALGAGDPAALGVAAADRELARELLASVDPLAVLALLTASRPPSCANLLYSGAPFGVGYLVAHWGWDG